MKMSEIIFQIRRQEDGWYLASPVHERIGGATEALDYDTLKEKIKEFLHLSLSDGFHKEVGLPENPPIRLIYSELLFENVQAEKILIAAASENNGYRASCNSYINLDLYHQNLDELKKIISKKIKEQGHDDKHVEFRLEEILQPEHSSLISK